MNIEIKSGSLTDFFSSAKETAKEIDRGETVTRKNTVWVDAKDLMLLLKPERTNLVTFLRKEKSIVFSSLAKTMKRSPVSLNHDLEILLKYGLVTITKKPNPGHGICKVIESNLDNSKIEFCVEI